MRRLFFIPLLLAAGTGEVFTIPPGPSWPCAPSSASLPRLMKWHRLMMDENSPDSVMNGFGDALMATKATMVGTKEQVEILIKGSGAYRVKILPGRNTRQGYQAETARGCWIDSIAFKSAK